MATQEDRSLSSGMSLPRWMKNRMNDRLDFEQTASSPIEMDGSFMYYFRGSHSNSELRNLTTVASTTAETQNKQTTLLPGHKPDFSRHTPFCQQYLENSNSATTAQKVIYPSATKTKPSGVDDGFKGEAAKCGSSVIRVANQMVRGFNLKPKSDCGDSPPEGFNSALRRGSKSLPASPRTSPKSGRRINKYFTGPFVETENQHGNWILSNLLSKRQNLSQSVGYIAEEDKGSGDLAKNSAPGSVDDVTDGGKLKNRVFMPKPSELREMNFWSPTSM